ncbi:MAG: hypothetical protein JWL62_3090 [Hyphomicrobiales bacterium]|jgi:hypothetical protein|nr:hypothetical protein [Hyphomicrobiales bacterium]
MPLCPTVFRSGLRHFARIGGQFAFSVTTAICAGVVTSLVFPHLGASPQATIGAPVMTGTAMQKLVPLQVPLSAAFTIEGLGRASTENMFPEYVLQVARPETGPDVGIADWAPPQGEPPARVARAEWDAPVRRGVELQRPHVVAGLPPRRPVSLVQQPAPMTPAPVRIAVNDEPAAPPASKLDVFRNMLPDVSIPHVLPSKAKVVGAMASIGDTLGGWVPRF